MSELFRSLFSNAVARSLAAGETLFRTGDRVSRVYLVRRGAIALRRTTSQGIELQLQTAVADDIPAEASIYSDRYHCDAVALSESDVMEVRKEDVVRALATTPGLAEAWSARLAHAVQEARLRAELRTLRTVRERIDAWLASGGAIPSKGRWQELAAELGVSREALYRELARRRP
ncbi:MAG: Crp/Fnr family transcriptional regulator [Bauldia sp.]|nr:Crp/Fnr family transcriptional regulator [Bauldia sp.]